MERYLFFPLAAISLILAIGVLVVALFGLKIGQIDVGGFRTITLRGYPFAIMFIYKRPAGLPVMDQEGRLIPERVAERTNTATLPPPKI